MSADGYLTDVPYVGGYYENLCPLVIRHAALYNKIAAPRTDRPFRYLELGCGLGESLATLAAANPNGEFVGVDVNPAHAKEASDRLAAGGVKNASVIESDFANLQDSVGQFDFICLHGVWSWVSSQVRDDILAVLCGRLNAGGMVAVSYNAMPGWASLQPIREMIYNYVSKRTGDTLSLLSEAMTYVKGLRDANASFFAANPRAASAVDSLLRHDMRYVAHEYLNESWQPFFHREVAGDFASRGFGYVGSMPLFTNMWNLYLSEPMLRLVNGERDRVFAEGHKDLCANTAFRWDVYTNGSPQIANFADRVAHFSDVYYTTAKRHMGTPFLAELGSARVPLGGPILEAIVDCISNASLNVNGIVDAVGYTGASESDICGALDAGLACGMFVASHRPLPLSQIDTSKPFAVSGDYNLSVVRNSGTTSRETALASEYTGNGHSVSQFDLLILSVTQDVIGEDEITKAVTERLRGLTLMSKGGAVESQLDREHVVRKSVAEFLRRSVHDYARLGLVHQNGRGEPTKKTKA